MTPIDPPPHEAAPDCYPTFWDAIPVDSAPEQPAPADKADDAYVTFLTLSEEGPTATLSVEESDVGLD